MSKGRWISSRHPRDERGRFRKKSGSFFSPENRTRRKATRAKNRRLNARDIARYNNQPNIKAINERNRKIGNAIFAATIAYQGGKLGYAIAGHAAATKVSKRVVLNALGSSAAKTANRQYLKRAVAKKGVYTITTLAGRKI